MFLHDIPPCKDCQKRYAHCHPTCKEYQDWKIDHEIRRQEVLEKEWASEQIRASKIDFCQRYWKRVRQKRK